MREPEAELPFTLDEYSERLRKVRARMERAGLDVLLVYWPENIYYLTGYDSLGYFSYQAFVLPQDGEPFSVVRRLERQNVIDGTWLSECEVYQDGEDPVARTIAALEARGLLGKRIGAEIDGYFLSPVSYKKIAAAVDLLDGSQIVNQVRLVKSRREVAYIRAACRAMEAGARAGIAEMKPGRTENDVAAALLSASVRAGSEYTGHAPLVATGPRSARSFATWSGRPIAVGDILAYEPAASVKRYHGLMVRTVSIGEPKDDRVRRLCDASVEGLDEGLSFLKPGITARELDEVTKRAPGRAGFGAFSVSRSGYGLGIGFPPDWGEGRTLSLGGGAETVIEANMTLHYMNPIWYEGFTKVSVSETVLVTETGCEVLTDFPRKLIVL